MKHTEVVIILDFGSQYSQLIARRVRELGVYSELHPFNLPLSTIRALNPKAIILSGGPASVYAPGAPRPSRKLFQLGVPILGICYGLQVIAHEMGGKVDPSARQEYGPAEVTIDDSSDLFAGLWGESRAESPDYIDVYVPPPKKPALTVWMSHGDALTQLPKGFERIAHSANSPICAVRNRDRKIFGVQFHPEVIHTPRGKEMLQNFLFRISLCAGDWNAGSFLEQKIQEIRQRVLKNPVICALSGGVDSSCLAVLMHRAVGDQLTCVHINNGLMRKNESEAVVKLYRNAYHFRLEYVDASALFLRRLRGVSDPERKRKIIGKTFIDVFEKEAAKLPRRAAFLAQGTLYPDVIESTSFRGPSHTIKSHHNVGGLPKKMRLKLVEPFRELFKDEVRTLGRLLELPSEFIDRHPFPGPGLAVRIIGDVTEGKLTLLREADDIFIQEIRLAGLYDTIWQAFAVLLPVQTVGVMGDQRTYENVIALRAVTSVDGMTADWAHLPMDLLKKVSGRIVNELRGVNRVVYDVSSKPPSTIEWE
jgi:GMP synthase (glutamine-hydrolysing)